MENAEHIYTCAQEFLGGTESQNINPNKNFMLKSAHVVEI